MSVTRLQFSIKSSINALTLEWVLKSSNLVQVAIRDGELEDILQMVLLEVASLMEPTTGE